MFERGAGTAAMAAWLLLYAPVAAQSGNLVPNGRFDPADGVSGWQVGSPEIGSLAFDASADADDCLASGVALATADPTVDFGTLMYSVCLGAVSVSESYWMSGEFRFESSAIAARANLTLSFYDGPGCSGTHLGGGFAGYAQSAVAGWQHLEAGPVTPPSDAVSAWLGVFLVQIVGADPAVQVQFDEIRVTGAGWIFAEDLEAGETCRWDFAAP